MKEDSVNETKTLQELLAPLRPVLSATHDAECGGCDECNPLYRWEYIQEKLADEQTTLKITEDDDPSNMLVRAGYLLALSVKHQGEDRGMLQQAARSLLYAPAEAAVREVKEETGLDIVFDCRFDPYAPLGFFSYEEHEAGAKGLHMNFNFVAHAPKREVVLCDEHERFDWVALRPLVARHDFPSSANERCCLHELKSFN